MMWSGCNGRIAERCLVRGGDALPAYLRFCRARARNVFHIVKSIFVRAIGGSKGTILNSCAMAMWATVTKKTEEQKRAVTELLHLVSDKAGTVTWERRKEALKVGTRRLLSSRASKGLEFDNIYWHELVRVEHVPSISKNGKTNFACLDTSPH